MSLVHAIGKRTLTADRKYVTALKNIPCCQALWRKIKAFPFIKGGDSLIGSDAVICVRSSPIAQDCPS